MAGPWLGSRDTRIEKFLLVLSRKLSPQEWVKTTKAWVVLAVSRFLFFSKCDFPNHQSNPHSLKNLCPFQDSQTVFFTASCPAPHSLHWLRGHLLVLGCDSPITGLPVTRLPHCSPAVTDFLIRFAKGWIVDSFTKCYESTLCMLSTLICDTGDR